MYKIMCVYVCKYKILVSINNIRNKFYLINKKKKNFVNFMIIYVKLPSIIIFL